MPTWNDLLVGALIAIVLILAVHRITENQRILCDHLVVPTRLVREDPETVNQLLDICQFHNIRVKGLEDYQKDMKSYLNVTAQAKAAAGFQRR